jgi:NAD-dependent dihydropyrimidine dehydrogenase PreA subunit
MPWLNLSISWQKNKVNLGLTMAPESKQCKCGSSIQIAGVCRRCYWRAVNDKVRFGGHREAVVARDRRCLGCGSTKLVVHHRRPRIHQDDLLITLCPTCHGYVEHGNPFRKYFPPLLLSLWHEVHGGMVQPGLY